MGQRGSHGEVAIIADKYLATGFRLAGVNPFPVRDAKEATATFEKIVEDEKYDVIIIAENLLMGLEKQRMALLAREGRRPVIGVIPDFKGSTGQRIKELRSLIVQSVGAELKFEE
jgi:vacuolar-type H+-ATPase subunit F/Vma7